MNGLEINKIAAAVLLAGVIGMTISVVTEALYVGEEGHGEAKRGYVIPGAETAGAEGGEAAPTGPVDILPYVALAVESGDHKTKGPDMVKRCTSCHTFDKGGPDKVGPNQWGLVGANVAHKDGYAYSDAMKALHGKRQWGFQELSHFIEAPAKDVPGTKMAYAGIRKPEDRAVLIAYLNTLSDSPIGTPSSKDHPLPKPGEETPKPEAALSGSSTENVETKPGAKPEDVPAAAPKAEEPKPAEAPKAEEKQESKSEPEKKPAKPKRKKRAVPEYYQEE